MHGVIGTWPRRPRSRTIRRRQHAEPVPALRLQPVPANAAAVFGPALPAAMSYAGILATRGVEQGLLGPREVPRLWDRHLLNCAVVAELIDPRCGTLLDIGSGAGLPGLVLAMLLPGWRSRCSSRWNGAAVSCPNAWPNWPWLT